MGARPKYNRMTRRRMTRRRIATLGAPEGQIMAQYGISRTTLYRYRREFAVGAVRKAATPRQWTDQEIRARIARLLGYKAHHIRDLHSGREKMRMAYIYAMRYLLEHPEFWRTRR